MRKKQIKGKDAKKSTATPCPKKDRRRSQDQPTPPSQPATVPVNGTVVSGGGLPTVKSDPIEETRSPAETVPQPTDAPPLAVTAGVRMTLKPFANYVKRDYNPGEACETYTQPELIKRLAKQCEGWPKRIDNRLFALDPQGRPEWLDNTDRLFAWLQRQVQVFWCQAPGSVSRNCLYRALQTSAPAFDALEMLPHFPKRPNVYYAGPDVPCGDGKALKKLVKQFQPATEDDAKLIRALFLSLFAGCDPGTQPAWLITALEGDDAGGRGVGKSKLVEVASLLVDGMIEISPKEDISQIKKRLLSPGAMFNRLVRIDNIKDSRFSWADLESLITAPAVSGHKLYCGEASRPNTLVWVLTVNGASLSKDMAQRCVVIKLKRPNYTPDWDETVKNFIQTNRERILGDVRAALENTPSDGTASAAPSSADVSFSRWAHWEKPVLAKVDSTLQLLQLVANRQAEIDDDDQEKELVNSHFRDQLQAMNHDPDNCCVFIPSATAALWLHAATKTTRPTNKASSYLKSLGIKELQHTKTLGKPGFRWHGTKSTESTMTRL